MNLTPEFFMLRSGLKLNSKLFFSGFHFIFLLCLNPNPDQHRANSTLSTFFGLKERRIFSSGLNETLVRLPQWQLLADKYQTTYLLRNYVKLSHILGLLFLMLSKPSFFLCPKTNLSFFFFHFILFLSLFLFVLFEKPDLRVKPEPINYRNGDPWWLSGVEHVIFPLCIRRLAVQIPPSL